MLIRSKLTTEKSAAQVWKGITNAEMVIPRPLCFKVGIPLPQKCEIVSYSNGIGKTRKCTSDKGFILQKITKYEENKMLEFHMEYNNLDIPLKIKSMSDNFVITTAGKYTTVVRTTSIILNNGYCSLGSIALIMGIKSVHRYVYKNIQAT